MNNDQIRKAINEVPRFQHRSFGMFQRADGEFVRMEDIEPLLERLIARPFVEITSRPTDSDQDVFGPSEFPQMVSPAEVYSIDITASGVTWQFQSIVCVGTPDAIVQTQERVANCGNYAEIVPTKIEPREK